jgi:hypothetical protein
MLATLWRLGSVSISEWIPSVFVILTAAAQAAILAFLIKRNKRADFPVFFWYNAFAVVGALVLFIAHAAKASGAHYFWLFWSVNTVLMLVEFGVMYEIFVKALKPYNGLIDLGKMLFRWAVAFLMLAAALTALATHDVTIGKCLAFVSQVERSLRLMQCGLLLLFFLFEKRLGLAWRSHTVSIGLGLGLTASLSLSSNYFHTRFAQWGFALDLVDYTTYLAVVAFWAICFYMREPERGNVFESPSKLIFQRWNEVLVSTRFAAGSAATASMGSLDSFLPNVEQTVDRVMARKMVQ